MNLKNRRYFRVLAYISILLCSISCSAQTSKSFTTLDGLLSDFVYCGLQDQEGFMWFATPLGISKFDGKNFTNFTVNDGLPTSDIFDLELAKDRIYFTAKTNRYGYIKNDSVFTYPCEGNKALRPTNVFVKGNDLIHASGNEYYKLKNDTWRTFFFHDRMSQMETIEHKLHFGKNNKIFLVDKKTLDTVVIHSANKTGEEHPTFDFPLNQKNQYIYGTISKYFLIIDLNQRFYKIYDLQNLLKGKFRFKYTKIRIDKHHIQFIGKDYNFTLDDSLRVLNFKIFKGDNFLGNFMDHSNNYWVFNYTQKLEYKITFPYIQHFFKDENVMQIKINDGVLYAGVYGKGAIATDLKTLKQSLIIPSPHNIYDIGTKKDKIFLTASITSLFNLKYNTLEAFKFKGIKSWLIVDSSIYFIASSGLYCQTLNEKNKYQIKKAGLLKIIEHQGKILVGGSSGLYELKKKKLLPLLKDPETSTSVSCFSSISSKWLAIGLENNGLCLLNGNRIIPIPVTKGLLISNVKVDQKQNLWLSTQKGLFEVVINFKDPSLSKINTRYTTIDGLPSNNIQDMDIYENLLYVATNKGVTVIDKKFKNILPQPYIRKVLVNNIKSTPQRLESLKHNENDLQIYFGCIDFRGQELLEYQYKITPGGKGWINTKEPVLNLVNLEPNEYIINLKITDSHNQIVYKAVKINIHKAWWQTTFFHLITALLIVLVLFSLFWAYRNNVNKKAKENIQQQINISELEMKALRAQMNPHFIFNSLNAINFLISENESKKAQKYVVKFSKLVRMFLETSRKEEIQLNNEIELLTEYLNIETLRFEDKISFEIQCDEELKAQNPTIPTMVLQPILENAINHGLFHKPSDGHISLNFSKVNDQSYMAIITDNGLGLKQVQKIQSISKRKHESISGSIMKERVKLLNQSKLWRITQKLGNLTESEDFPGTKVELNFTRLT